jgi:hypothetical protein
MTDEWENFTKQAYTVEKRDGKLYAAFKGHEFGPYDEEHLNEEMRKNIKLVLNAEYGKLKPSWRFGQLDEFSKWAQKRTVECMEEAQAQDDTGEQQYLHGMVEAYTEADLALRQVKLDHNHKCYWKDRYDELQRVIEDELGSSDAGIHALEEIKKRMSE